MNNDLLYFQTLYHVFEFVRKENPNLMARGFQWNSSPSENPRVGKILFILGDMSYLGGRWIHFAKHCHPNKNVYCLEKEQVGLLHYWAQQMGIEL